ncbi:hypothetical protein ONZ45_g3980 [Pleurotus djamor]|nr:hypothetical protein ONZ45_g3980 [Pleurotus djamor]
MTRRSNYEKQLQEDLQKKFLEVTVQNKLLTVDEAMKQVQAEVLANNPYVPPADGKCPIGKLPNEILGHIFFLGTLFEDDDSDDEDDEDESLDGTSSDGDIDLADGWETTSEGSTDHPIDLDVEIVDEDASEDDVSMDDDSSSSSSCTTEPADVPFQVLVSHVSRLWRNVALSTPSLWTRISFGHEDAPFDRCKVWIERSGSLPLDIELDLCRFKDFDEEKFKEGGEYEITMNENGDVIMTGANNVNTLLPMDSDGDYVPPDDPDDPDDVGSDVPSEDDSYYTESDVNTMLDIICPHSRRWRQFAVEASRYSQIHLIMTRLETLPSAESLEVLDLRHPDEDPEEDDTFYPPSLRLPFFVPFHGQAPHLKQICLWGVHIAWDQFNLAEGDLSPQPRSTTLLLESPKELRDLQLAFHANDVRPSYAAFATMVESATHLTKLTLSASGPTAPSSDWVIAGAPPTKLSMPHLKVLDLRYHDPQYASDLVKILDVPALKELTLDYDSMDYTEFVKVLAGEQSGNNTTATSSSKKRRSILNGLEFLKISSLPCDNARIEHLLGELGNVQHLLLKCATDEVTDIFQRLEKPIHPSNPDVFFCPSLKILSTTDITEREMKAMVKARKDAGMPLRKVRLCLPDQTPDDLCLKWLKENLPEGYEYFEDSDSEDDGMIELSDDDDGFGGDLDFDVDEDDPDWE